MIKSDDGEVLVMGQAIDVVFELHQLIRTIAEKHPELISAVIYKKRRFISQDSSQM